MAAITVKNIPDNLYESLKVSATTHRRSINSELIVCLEKVLLPTKATPQDHVNAARKLRSEAKGSLLTDKDMGKAKNAGRR